jgi:hypothetical protein
LTKQSNLIKSEKWYIGFELVLRGKM